MMPAPIVRPFIVLPTKLAVKGPEIRCGFRFAREYRRVIRLNQANVDAFANTKIDTASHLHRKARNVILNRKIELWEQVDRLRLAISVASESRQNMTERFQPPSTPIVLELPRRPENSRGARRSRAFAWRLVA